MKQFRLAAAGVLAIAGLTLASGTASAQPYPGWHHGWYHHGYGWHHPGPWGWRHPGPWGWHHRYWHHWH